MHTDVFTDYRWASSNEHVVAMLSVCLTILCRLQALKARVHRAAKAVALPDNSRTPTLIVLDCIAGC